MPFVSPSSRLPVSLIGIKINLGIASPDSRHRTMDGDPAVEPELDSFSLTLPLPYRVAIILVAGNI